MAIAELRAPMPAPSQTRTVRATSAAGRLGRRVGVDSSASAAYVAANLFDVKDDDG